MEFGMQPPIPATLILQGVDQIQRMDQIQEIQASGHGAFVVVVTRPRRGAAKGIQLQLTKYSRIETRDLTE